MVSPNPHGGPHNPRGYPTQLDCPDTSLPPSFNNHQIGPPALLLVEMKSGLKYLYSEITEILTDITAKGDGPQKLW